MPELSYGFDLPFVSRCVVCVGDYIRIAIDFSAGVKNPTWIPIHEHMLKARSTSFQYTRGGKSVAWGADFIFLDLPFGGTLYSPSEKPAWDQLTEEHVRSGIVLSATTSADSGWLLIMASFGGTCLFVYCYIKVCNIYCLFIVHHMIGDCIGLVERFCRGSGLFIFRRILVRHHCSYGYFENNGERVEVCNL